MDDPRPSPLAGRWYSADAATLAANIDKLLAAAPPVTPPAPGCGVAALLAPHAGHQYSGAVAGRAFRAVAGLAVDLVVIAGPSHFHADGSLLTSAHSHYVTPLGSVPVDQAALNTLERELNAVGRGLLGLRKDREHALEIELPFLQRTLAPGFTLLPLMLRDQSIEQDVALAGALATVLRGRRALLVASSDLSHFYPQATAEQMDGVMLAAVGAFDPVELLAAQAAGRGQACGVGAIAAVWWAAQALGAAQAQVLGHSTSGQVTGDLEEVVGYGAAVVWKC